MKCNYCGEEDGKVEIEDPNGTDKRWLVCITCQRIIREQQGLVFSTYLKKLGETHSIDTSFMDKHIQKHKDELNYLSRESGKEFLVVEITPKERKNGVD